MKEGIYMRKKAQFCKVVSQVLIGFTFIGGVATYAILDKEISSLNYYFTGMVSLISAILAYYFHKKNKRLNNIIFLKENWPNTIKRKVNLEYIKKYFTLTNEEKKNTYFVDDQTWTDLDMDDVFLKIDNSITTPGQHVLYSVLRNPLFKEEELRERNEVIEFFQNNTTERENLQVSLLGLGIQRQGNILELFNHEKVDTRFKFVYDILGIIPLVILPFYFVYGLQILLPLMIIYLINSYIQYKVGNNIVDGVNSIAYLGRLIAVSKDIAKGNNEVLKSFIAEISLNLKEIKDIDKHSDIIGRVEGLDVLGDYVSILFLAKLRSYYKAIHKIYDYNENIKKIYRVVGEIDSLISIASYRERIKNYSTPKFEEGHRELILKEAVHPLIDEAIPNSITLDKSGIILTGSNMSGKSTFLRTVALNALLAQTLYTTLAKEYKGSFFKILTSLSPEDSVKKGKSYYLGEAEALLRILNSFEEEVSTLTMIDEIFRGTNPVERISASEEILKYISGKNALALVATHDLELTEISNDNYDCYYFSEDVDDKEGLKFDYTIKLGVSPTRNAIKLLKYIGYPDEIVNGANERINMLMKKEV